MKKLYLILLSAMLLGCSQDNSSELVTEVKKIRETNRKATIQIDEVVNKYIRVGMSSYQAKDYLVRNGFSVHDISDRSGEKIMASYPKEKPKFSFGFYDEIRVILTLDGDIVSDVSGFLFFHSL